MTPSDHPLCHPLCPIRAESQSQKQEFQPPSCLPTLPVESASGEADQLLDVDPEEIADRGLYQRRAFYLC